MANVTQDQFGGIPVSEDEFGGVLVDEESPSSVIRDVPRGTLEPTDLFPGIRKIGGEIVPGQIGDTHQDIIKREGIKAEDLDQRVFVTPWGDVIDREGAANAVFPKVIPQFETGRLHSTDLIKAEETPKFEQPLDITEQGPVYQSAIDAANYGSIQESNLTPWQKIRRSETGRKLFGPTTEEQELGIVPEQQPGIVPILTRAPLPFGLGPETTAGKALLGYFIYDFASSVPEAWRSFRDAVIRGDWKEAGNIAVNTGFGAAFTALAGKGLHEYLREYVAPVKPTYVKAPPTEIPGEAPLAAPTEGKAEVGEVVQAAPTEPAITTDKTVLPEKQVELSKEVAPAPKADAAAQEAATETGFTLSPERQIGALKMSSLPPETIAKLKEGGQVPNYEFTDQRPDSPTRGVTFYVPEGATKQQILDTHKAVVEQFKKAETPAAPDMGIPTTVETAASLRAKADEAERIAYKASAALESAERTKQPKSVLDPLYAEVSRTEKEAIKAEELADEAERKGSIATPTEPTTVAAPTPEPIRAGPGEVVPATEITSLRKEDVRNDERLDMPGITRTVKPNSLVVQIRDLQSRPIKDIVLKSSGDPITDAKKVQNTIRKQVNEHGGDWSIRESLAVTTGPNGRAVLKFGISPNGMTWAPAKSWIDLVERTKTPPAVAEPITLEMELGAGVSLRGVSDAVKASVEYLKSLRNEELKAPKMNDRRRAVLNWSAKLQRSYGEAFSKQRDIIGAVPNKTRREGITNWIQANGDRTVLQDRYNATSDPKLKAGYKAALELTPAEIAVANSVKADYADFATRGQDAGVLGDLKDNYVTQTWNLKKGPGGTGTGRTLKEKFRFSKARTFESFFDGEQLGYTPKTKDIAKLLPMYSHEMNSVIAAREMVAEMGNGVASDGRPLLAPKGVGIPVDAAEGGKATLVIPKAGKVDTSDYKVLPNQPALSGWKWVAKDDAGNPVFLKADLAVHPEAVAYLKNVLGRSAIRDWYGTRTTALAELPKILVKGIDMANSETKRTMLGMLATFHQIQTGTHAVGHRVSPFFSIPKIDLVNNKVQMDAAQHGLMMLPDRASMDQFMEGFRTSGLISRIPGIGPIADYYSHYLFHEYIPGLKFKTYEAILGRNQKVYAKDLAAGRVTPSDIKILSAEQANAAYGHLNYADLGRNPTVQHIAQVGLLAPDFLEARGRFAGQAIKGVAGAKVGREQLLALATLAIAQTAAAYVVSRIVDGEWDKKRPFEFVKGNRRYTVRSVPEDIVNLVTKTRQFIHSRLSPLVGKGLLQYLTGVDYRGQKVKALQTTKELAAQPLPLTIRGFTGLGNNTLSGMEQLAGSLGLRISRYSPSLDVYDMVKEFKKSSDDPKLQADIELQEKEVFSSVYDKLRTALRAGDLGEARKEYDKVKAIRTPKQIDNAMKPWTGGNLDKRTFQISPRKPKPFTGSAKTEKLFLQGLNPEQRTMYDKAVKERLEFYNTFKQMLALPGGKETDEFGGIPVE